MNPELMEHELFGGKYVVKNTDGKCKFLLNFVINLWYETA